MFNDLLSDTKLRKNILQQIIRSDFAGDFAEVVEGAFLEANPGLKPDQITVTCRDGMIQEVRLCLTKDLAPRRCGADVIRDCRLKDAVLEPLR